ncbi:MAG TPA: glutathione S-transferase family protein [Rhizomicrobium sp.]|jgi:glutathione S-transferase/RNA polymerase-associated protein|nr:glutathione S-transferase family protein [Rhizomicrobium sp.]
MSVIVYEHPLSPYAQKVKIALDEKGVAHETKMPVAIGTGQPDLEFLKANPRGEVPALIDGEVSLFDSTIILEYIEDKWPEPPLLPRDAAARAKARTIEDVMDTSFEPINWGLGEIRWFKRAEGEQARAIEARAHGQARGFYEWLTRQLGSEKWFGGETFGWGDLCVVPYLNGATGNGIGPAPDSPLGLWLARANARASVQKAAKAAADSLKSMTMVADAVKSGMFKREYRDHRLEWMVRSGGLDVVLEGLKAGNIRFSNELG